MSKKIFKYVEIWQMHQILLNHSYVPIKTESVLTSGSCMRPSVFIEKLIQLLSNILLPAPV